MFMPKIALSLIVASGALLPIPAVAAAPPIETFRSIEFGADPAARIDDVQASLAERLPAGSPVADARVLLHTAGAHCRAPKADGSMRCRYSDMHIQDDIMQDVSWTVDFQTAGDRIVSFAVARDPAID